jgi:hypothetical protein
VGVANCSKSRISFQVQTERGLRWEMAMDIYMDHSGDNDGFYMSTVRRPICWSFLSF